MGIDNISQQEEESETRILKFYIFCGFSFTFQPPLQITMHKTPKKKSQIKNSTILWKTNFKDHYQKFIVQTHSFGILSGSFERATN